MRPSGRANNEMRQVKFTRNYTMHAEGSVLVEFGNTKVLCTATVDSRTPPWLRGKGQGWLTAEYGMLPRSTHSRIGREAARGKQSGRTQEIQRLIGRSLRAVVNLEALGERQIIIDCDVIQADGGTRTAAISGGYVALCDAVQSLLDLGKIKKDPLMGQLASVSVGIYEGEAVIKGTNTDEKKTSQPKLGLLYRAVTPPHFYMMFALLLPFPKGEGTLKTLPCRVGVAS